MFEVSFCLVLEIQNQRLNRRKDYNVSAQCARRPREESGHWEEDTVQYVEMNRTSPTLNKVRGERGQKEAAGYGGYDADNGGGGGE